MSNSQEVSIPWSTYRRRYLIASGVVALVGLLCTLAVSWQLKRQVDAIAAARFEKLINFAVHETIRRVNQVVYGLRGARGVYFASQEVSRDEFRQYVASRDLPGEFPGALGFGFVQRVAPGDLEAFIAAERADGAPDFKVHADGKPLSTTSDLFVIKHLEPLAENRVALGFDVGSDPVRRAAMLAAIDSGKPTLSQPVTLIHDSKATGLVYFLPVYERGSNPVTIEERRSRLVGLLVAPVILEGALQELGVALGGLADIEIFHGTEVTPKGLIFDFDGHNRRALTEDRVLDFSDRSFRAFTPIGIGGQQWLFATSTTDAFDATVDYTGSRIVAIGGIIITALSALAVYRLGTTSDRAMALAKSMTADLTRMAMVAQRTTNAVVLTDANKRITWVNDGFTRISGYTLDEVAGKIPGEILQCEKTDPQAIARIRQALDSGLGCREEILNRAKDGSYYYLDLEIQPLRDAANNLTGYIAIESDITDAVQQRQALADQVAKLEEAEALANLGHWSWDTATGRVEWSKQIFTIHRRDPQQGEPDYPGMLALYSPECATILDAAVQTALDTGAPYQIVLRTSDADERYLEAAGNVRRDASGTIVALYGTVRDVTAQVLSARQLNEALAAAEAATRAKSDFLANMSHEIRTPMTAIIGYTELLAEDGNRANAPRRRLDYVDTIRRNGEHLLTIINDILDLSKIEAGKMTVESIATQPSQIFHDVVSIMQVKASEKNITLNLSCLTDIPATITTDPVRFRQILVNLVSNAVKFTESGGVTINASLLPNSMLQIEVTDTGIGMTEQQISRLFNAFEQADASTTRKFGGTGLGLRISKMLSRLLGGDLTVTSVPGEGTTFVVTVATGDLTGVPMIPAATAMLVVQSPDKAAEIAPGIVATAPASASTRHQPLRGVRILLAEDGVDNQRLITFHLTKAGASITVADNGRIALSHLTSDSGTVLLDSPPFDLLVTDMQMPEMDGYTLASTLRKLGSPMPVIALTAHAMSGDAQRCLDAGCDAYTSKPVNRDQLIELCIKFARTRSSKSAAPRAAA